MEFWPSIQVLDMERYTGNKERVRHDLCYVNSYSGSRYRYKFICIIFSVCTGLMMLTFDTKYAAVQEPWRAPSSADSLVNPYYIEPLTLPQGQEIYTIYCAPCHGSQGKADGLATHNLRVKPLKFQDKKVSDQTNGALFWKIREGRGEMPSFKDLLSEEQKWQLVEYLRDISKPFDKQMNPFKVKH